MLSKFLVRSLFLSLTMVSVQAFLAPAYSQQNPNVSAVRLSVQQASDGSQSVLTPKGLLVPLPGAGVNNNYLDLYMGAAGGYWYVDKHGKSEDITSYVNQVRAKTAQMQTATPPQYAPYPTSNTNTNTNTNIGTSSSGGGALATATAAGVGAMVGAGVANYHNVPYGSPMYYGSNGNPYYRDVEGKGILVDDGEVQWDNVAKGKSAQNYRQTQKVNDAKAYQQQRAGQQQTQQQQNIAAMQANQGGNRHGNNMQAQNFQQQQQWYSEQSKDKGLAQSWKQESAGDNPFVRSDDSSRSARGERGDNSSRGREARGGRDGGGRGGREAGGRGGRGGGGRRGR